MNKNQLLDRLLDMAAAKAVLDTVFANTDDTRAYYKIEGAIGRTEYDLKEEVKHHMKSPSEKRRKRG
jgi:hypothetical protein